MAPLYQSEGRLKQGPYLGQSPDLEHEVVWNTSWTILGVGWVLGHSCDGSRGVGYKVIHRGPTTRFSGVKACNWHHMIYEWGPHGGWASGDWFPPCMVNILGSYNVRGGRTSSRSHQCVNKTLILLLLMILLEPPSLLHMKLANW